jgi:leucyl-tRNA synthetase
MKFNTAISAMMIFQNAAEEEASISTETYKTYLKLLAPFAPHITEELWSGLGESKSIHLQSWPEYDEKLLKDEVVQIVVQVNGKVRAKFDAPAGASKDQVLKLALQIPKIKEYIDGQNIAKTIHIPDKLLNIVA